MPAISSGSRLFAEKVWRRVSYNPRSLPARARRYLAGPGSVLSLLDVWRTARRVSRQYETWLAAHTPRPAELRAQTDAASRLPYTPTISVLMPVYNTAEKWLRLAIESVLAQSYPYWQLCLADDASTAGHIRPLLEAYQASDPRITVAFRPQSGHISAASNSALSLASGEFVALLDHDDELAPNALFEVVRLLNEHPDADLVYTDEDKIDEDGRHTEPYFKPAWSPRLLLGMNYITHLAVLRRTLVAGLGGFRDQYVGSQDHDLFLRVSEQTARVYHIPLVLYHWRKIASSAASIGEAKGYAYAASLRAVEDAVSRRHLAATVEPGLYPPFVRVRWQHAERPLVSVIFAAGRVPAALKRRTVYPHVEYVAAGELPLLQAYRAGADAARGEFLLFMQPGLLPARPDWLDALLEYAQLPDTGCVGPKIVARRSGKVRHAGLVIRGGAPPASAVSEVADVPHILFVVNGYKDSVRNVSAVSEACMLVRRSVYDGAGGFDSAYHDALFGADLCLRLGQGGYTTVYTPHARLLASASAVSLLGSTPRDAHTFQQRWGAGRDPHYSPHLTAGGDAFGLVAGRAP